MTNDNVQSNLAEAASPEDLILPAVACGLANGVRTLVPTCTAAVVVGIGGEWQLLAQRGPTDVASAWRESMADRVRETDRPQQDGGYLVTPFSAVGMHALLIVCAEHGEQLPERVHEIVQPLLDAGGILLDRARTAQERERVLRRVVLVCQERNGLAPRTLAELEHALASLWPNATARFYDRMELGSAPWSSRRLVRATCARDQTAIARTPVAGGLLPQDLAYQVAIPMPQDHGAIVIESYAGGEEPDNTSVAAAVAIARSATHPHHNETLLAHSV